MFYADILAHDLPVVRHDSKFFFSTVRECHCYKFGAAHSVQMPLQTSHWLTNKAARELHKKKQNIQCKKYDHKRKIYAFNFFQINFTCYLGP